VPAGLCLAQHFRHGSAFWSFCYLFFFLIDTPVIKTALRLIIDLFRESRPNRRLTPCWPRLLFRFLPPLSPSCRRGFFVDGYLATNHIPPPPKLIPAFAAIWRECCQGLKLPTRGDPPSILRLNIRVSPFVETAARSNSELHRYSALFCPPRPPGRVRMGPGAGRGFGIR